MRPSDVLWGAPSTLSSVAAAWSQEWLGLLAVLAASLLIWDVRRAGGLAAWMVAWPPTLDAWGEYLSRAVRRREKRRRVRLQGRQRRRELRKRS